MKKWYAVIGDPIGQSKSPAMHDSWLAENELEATYIPLHVSEENLEKTVASLRLLGCSGWNVTVPHKRSIIPLLDELDPSATLMDAVNTVEVLPNGSLRGSNTDGQGFVRSLEEAFGVRCKGERVLLIGAGGAARGIGYALQAAGYGPITFTNRTFEKAESLAKEIPQSKALPIVEAEAALDTFGLIVQTTSVGMNFSQSGMPLNPQNVANESIVADIIYNPIETEFIKTARVNGALVMNGVGMFVNQGALSFEKWTSIQPNTEKMNKKITNNLGGSYVNK